MSTKRARRKTKQSKATPLTLERILFGDPERHIPDPLDEMILREIEKAGREGTTQTEVAERLLGRELTEQEHCLVIIAEEMGTCEEEETTISQVELKAAIADLAHMENAGLREAMLSAIKKGRLVDSGERRDGHIVWMPPVMQ